MSFKDRIEELYEWLISLPPDFAFLLALPFVIAAVAVAWDAIRRPKERRERKPKHNQAAHRRWGRVL